MVFRIDRYFRESSFNFQERQFDYDLFENNNVSVFVYGYPVDLKLKSWIKAENIFHFYIKNEWETIKNFDGVYALVILDKGDEKLYIITDRLGIYSLFYHQSQNSLLISDDIREIKKLVPDASLNQNSVIEYLNLGFKIGNKTHFENIFETEPATIYTIDRDLNKEEEQYWSVFNKTIKERISIEEFRILFNTNIQTIEELEDCMVLPVSGGRDTRTVLSAIKDKTRLRCYTFGPDWYHSDLSEAEKICNHLGIDHSLFIFGDHWAKQIDFDRDIKEMNRNGLGPTFYNLYVKESFEKIRDIKCVTLQGDLTNQLWRHHPFGKNIPDSMDVHRAALFMIKNLTRVLYFKSDLTGFYGKLYRNYSIKDIEGLLTNSVRNDLLKLSNPGTPSDYSEYFILRTLCYNFYSYILNFIGRHTRLFMPCLQKDLLEQIHLLSINERVEGKYQDYIISRNNRYLYKLPYRHSGRVAKYLKLITNLSTAKIIGKELFPHPELHNYPEWIRKYHKDHFCRILDFDRMILSNFFNRDAFNAQLDIFIKNKYSVTGKRDIMYKFSNQHFIYNVYSLEKWLQGL